MLQWALGGRHPFGSRFSPDICPGSPAQFCHLSHDPVCKLNETRTHLVWKKGVRLSHRFYERSMEMARRCPWTHGLADFTRILPFTKQGCQFKYCYQGKHVLKEDSQLDLLTSRERRLSFRGDSSYFWGCAKTPLVNQHFLFFKFIKGFFDMDPFSKSS